LLITLFGEVLPLKARLSASVVLFCTVLAFGRRNLWRGPQTVVEFVVFGLAFLSCCFKQLMFMEAGVAMDWDSLRRRAREIESDLEQWIPELSGLLSSSKAVSCLLFVISAF
jgi:hypothetical protein